MNNAPNMKIHPPLLLALPFLLTSLHAQEEETTTADLLDGNEWKYNDSGQDLGTDWKAPGFDDADWDSGPAPLGYEDDDIATELSFGPDPEDKHITSYLRTAFTIPAGKKAVAIRASLRADDGAILYLNGQEVARFNLPDSDVDYDTPATEIISRNQEGQFHDYVLDASAAQAGRNVLAVEMHQRGPTSSDLIFDLNLEADLETLPEPQSATTPTEVAATDEDRPAIGSKTGARFFKRGRIKRASDWTAFKKFFRLPKVFFGPLEPFRSN